MMDRTVGDHEGGQDLTLDRKKEILHTRIIPRLVSYKTSEFHVKSDAMLQSPKISKKSSSLMQKAIQKSTNFKSSQEYLFRVVEDERAWNKFEPFEKSWCS